jgi:hypothetical protein
MRGVQGEVQGGARRHDRGEAKQEPPAPYIPRPPRDWGLVLPEGLTGDGNLQGQANPRIAPLALSVDYVTERLELDRGDVREGHAVEDAALCRNRILPPDHLGFRLNGPRIRLELNPDWPQRPQAFSQLHTSPPLAQVAAPAHADA